MDLYHLDRDLGKETARGIPKNKAMSRKKET